MTEPSPILLVCMPVARPWAEHTLRWLFEERWGQPVHFSHDVEEWRTWEGPRLAYGPSDPGFRPWLPSSGVIHEPWNTETLPDVVRSGDNLHLFPVQGLQADTTADLVAGIFWMISRAEEYRSPHADTHGRFPANRSLGFREGFLDRPVADIWAEEIRRIIQRYHPELLTGALPFRRLSTYDIDFAWRYRHKSLPGLVRAVAGDLVREGLSTFLRGLAVWTGRHPDPYDLYEDWIGQQAVLFFPVGDTGPLDRQADWQRPAYRQLIRDCYGRTPLGLHPSYPSMSEPERFHKEMSRFADITGSLPERSRQHFLRMQLPETYRHLVDAGIREDWTMGFADAVGFRAGTAWPYPWFDIDLNRRTPLRVIPFQAMDVTLGRYLGLSVAEARDQLAKLDICIRETGGTLVTIAHANSVAAWDQVWQGWDAIPWGPGTDPGHRSD